MRRHIFAVLSALSAVLFAGPAGAQVKITQANAKAGNVTPGDAAGFPVTLSVAGSYRLGSNLYPGSGLDGILAESADITIDLNGFTISGGPASGGFNNARVGINGQGDRLTVKNGTIGAFASSAIYAEGRHYVIVENMRILNSNVGIYTASGLFTRIQNSTVATNRDNGIICGSSCHIEGTVVSSNQNAGIVIQSGTVLGNTIVENASVGVVVSSTGIIGLGNNTIFKNSAAGDGKQIGGPFIRLHPNACSPVAC